VHLGRPVGTAETIVIDRLSKAGLYDLHLLQPVGQVQVGDLEKVRLSMEGSAVKKS